ncbi:MAG: hypothetical protein PHI12_08765 [Dehalococcoidales bacterium]|nr:hypothetical protein [Dehalococcoidales bacterium]
MTDAQINETLAQESGFTDFEIKPWNALFARYPDDNIKRVVPDFLNDFNACLTHIAPKIPQFTIRKCASGMFEVMMFGSFEIFRNELLSRAFCMAAIKYFEGEK